MAFSLFGGGEAEVGLSLNATIYALPSGEQRSLQEIARANDGVVSVIEVDVPATVESVLRSFKRFKIVAQPSWFVDEGARMRIDQTVNLMEEEDEDA